MFESKERVEKHGTVGEYRWFSVRDFGAKKHVQAPASLF